ncbi:uncharacterized protein LOC110036762 [Phalaenopsis equestris]|uniref:uncharacterized protein LOC110036762 n=1 Tax=Phalaenopsis equestris TaxID=78828 RepID=UPI0009E4D34F|nr:uncharacterized protein LOC110036762 [Phalaenopsis equestris]
MANFPVPEPQNSQPSPRFAANITGGANCFDVRYLQTLENDTASSILHFFVRQRMIPEYVVNAAFLALPLPNPISFSLKKDTLLRRLASELVLRSVSEETLRILELIEELDRKNSHCPPSEVMKAAYCAVASSCTATALHQNVDDFLDSFHRIWVLRICDVEKSAAAALISEELREVRDIFWEVVKDPKLRPLVANIDLEETLDLVRDYLEEVWDMKPLFPEVAADEIDGALRIPGERMKPRKGPSGLRNQTFGCVPNTKLERLVTEEGMKAQNGIAEPIIASDSESNGQLDQDRGLEISKRSSQLLNADVDDEQALKESYLDLRRMLQNTLLDAANKATELQAVNSEEACGEETRVNDVQNITDEVASMSTIGTNSSKCLKPSSLTEKEEHQNGQDLRRLMASEKVYCATADEKNHTQNNNNFASFPRISLMEKNPTAHTVEWMESPPREGRFRLRSPKREIVSPLKLIDDRRYAKRRKIRKWTLLEEETLIKAVREHGKGSWKQILSNYPNIFEERTEVDLKDKWRNITKSSLLS